VSNQDIVDEVERSVSRILPIDLREKVLEAVWNVLQDNREEPN
jgi:hypothetical protein